MVSSARKIVCSFDVFDTCITRTYAKPTDLFYVLAKVILPKNSSKANINAVATARIKAEKKARQGNQDKEGVTLEDIYEVFAMVNQWNLSIARMKEQELLLEKNCIRSIFCTKLRIQRMRAQGHRIIFISDMYLPRGFIHERLIEHGIADNNDAVYVSGAVGLVKWTGGLFKYVLEKEKLSCNELHHYGDNPRSDVSIPSRLGIKATLFGEITPNYYEKNILAKSYAHSEKLSNIAGISRVTRLAHDVEDLKEKEIVQLAANVIGPFLTAFVLWVVKEASENGFDRLYFVSRDGQILYKIAKKLSNYIDVPECRYIYGSRQAWYLPSLISRDGSLDFNSVTNPNKSRAPRDILKRIDIIPEMISSKLERFDFKADLDRQLSLQELEKFKEYLKFSKVTDLIRKRAKEAKKITLEYFFQEGLFINRKWSCVDAGWRLTSQYALKRILDGYIHQTELHGYYIGVTKDRVSHLDRGPYRSFIEQDVPNSHLGGKNCNWMLKKSAVHLVESVFLMADHPTVIRYEKYNNSIKPVFKEHDISYDKKTIVETLHHTILDYVDEIMRTDLIKNHSEIFIETAFDAAHLFLKYPRRADVSPLTELTVYNEHTHDTQWEERLARELKVNDLVRIVAETLNVAEHLEKGELRQLPVWLEGSAALSSPAIKLMFRLLQKGKQILST